MKRTVLILGLCITGLSSATAAQTTAPVSADPWFRGGTWMVTAEIGGTAFSDFQRSQARPAGTTTADDFSRRISARTAVSFGAWASYWLSDSWGLRTGIAYVPSSFTVWNDDPGTGTADGPAHGYEEASYASLDVWMANAALTFRFPRSFGRVAPYGIGGVGLLRYRAKSDADLPPEARAEFADGDRQHVAAVFGIGATIPLQRRNLLMSFELTNHLSGTPLAGQGSDQTFELDGRLIELSPDVGDGKSDVGLTSHVRLAVGLTLPLR